ncbi:hypothetical protein ACFXTN_028023 [Malus domestica]
MWNVMLVRRFFSRPHLNCLSPPVDLKILSSIHEGVCGNHFGGQSLAQKALNAGYYWSTMHQDAKEYVQRVQQLPVLQACARTTCQRTPSADKPMAINAMDDRLGRTNVSCYWG